MDWNLIEFQQVIKNLNHKYLSGMASKLMSFLSKNKVIEFKDSITIWGVNLVKFWNHDDDLSLTDDEC